jgi:predicted signal transduction protein with EAL and GGDEF domain
VNAYIRGVRSRMAWGCLAAVVVALLVGFVVSRRIVRPVRALAASAFGTGYSSLGYLRRFPFDTLKVDRSFVRDLLVDEGSAAITGAVVAMAQKLHLNVVAEGVETVEQLEYLRAIGCAQVQGFYFSPALPPAEFSSWVAGRVADDELSAPRAMPHSGRYSAIPPLHVR